MPTLYVLAGPNGAGKTTFYQQSVSEGFISKELPFVNVDLIARDLPGGYTEVNFTLAAERARQQISDLISTGKSFMIESNLAKEADYKWLENMKKAGYELILYFLSTNDILINIDRVERRVKEGGHFIPPHIVTDRYKMCLLYLRTKLDLFEEAHLIDNSSETIETIALLKGNRIVFKQASPPSWASDILTFAQRLSKRN